MLPAALRMRSSSEFGLTVRGGVRAGRTTVVVHARRVDPPRPATPGRPGPAESGQVKIGFVVPKTVGGAVVRNRVKRRLRHLARAEAVRTPPGTHLVVRALPPSATSDQLDADLTSAWRRCLSRLAEQPAGPVAPPPAADRR